MLANNPGISQNYDHAPTIRKSASYTSKFLTHMDSVVQQSTGETKQKIVWLELCDRGNLYINVDKCQNIRNCRVDAKLGRIKADLELTVERVGGIEGG